VRQYALKAEESLGLSYGIDNAGSVKSVAIACIRRITVRHVALRLYIAFS
jgi:hypothetical protein